MITLSTDFGYRDPFVGMMKGVILGINPEALITDISHGIPSFDIREASRIIEESYRYFPPGSIHVVVVDPGVGSARRPVILSAGGHLFVGPDNGVFTGVIRSTVEVGAVHITEEKYFLRGPSEGRTFHGRDIFAPAAAWLSKGVAPGEFGVGINDLVTLDIPSPSAAGNVVRGEVAAMDAFGNCITNITASDMEKLPRGTVSVEIKGLSLDLLGHYAEAGDQSPHALINSSGRVEIFVNRGNASSSLDISVGETVRVVSTLPSD